MQKEEEEGSVGEEIFLLEIGLRAGEQQVLGGVEHMGDAQVLQQVQGSAFLEAHHRVRGGRRKC